MRDGEVLLARKQNKIGAGRLNGFGGKAEQTDANIVATNARELEEEIGIKATRVRWVGEILFRNFAEQHELRNMEISIFIVDEWTGEPAESSEMKDILWYRIESIDYEEFLSGDRLFLPHIFAGKSVQGEIHYDENWSVTYSNIKEVSRL
jgi:8-oxo-dGTP diphosphatase